MAQRSIHLRAPSLTKNPEEPHATNHALLTPLIGERLQPQVSLTRPIRLHERPTCRYPSTSLECVSLTAINGTRCQHEGSTLLGGGVCRQSHGPSLQDVYSPPPHTHWTCFIAYTNLQIFSRLEEHSSHHENLYPSCPGL
jgi:hypothetical protein